MFRVTNILLVSLAIMTACLSYAVKYDTQFKAETLEQLGKQISKEMEGLRVTNVEWNYLTRPERLKNLASMRPDLQTMSLSQIVTPDEVAARIPLTVEAEIDDLERTTIRKFSSLPRQKPNMPIKGSMPQ